LAKDFTLQAKLTNGIAYVISFPAPKGDAYETFGKIKAVCEESKSHQRCSPEEFDQIRERMIAQELVIYEIESRTGPIGAVEIRKQAERIASINNLSQKELREEVEKVQPWSEFENQVRSSIAEARFMEILEKSIIITPSEISSQRQKKLTGKASKRDWIQLRSLYLSTTDPELDQKIVKIKQGLDKKIPFRNLILQHSQDKSSFDKEGLLEPRSIDSFPEEIQESLQTLKTNEVKGPFRLGTGAYFFEKIPTKIKSNKLDLPEKEDKEIKREILQRKQKDVLAKKLEFLKIKYDVRIKPLPKGLI
jgi:hypothetical protein